MSVAPSVLNNNTLDEEFKLICFLSLSKVESDITFSNPANPAAPDSPEIILTSLSLGVIIFIHGLYRIIITNYNRCITSIFYHIPSVF